MKKAGVVIAVLILATGVFFFAKSRKTTPGPHEARPDGGDASLPVASDTGTAADMVPEDCTFFAAMLRLGELYDLVARSNAAGKLFALPLVQGQLAQLKASPGYRQLTAYLETDPTGRSAMVLAKDTLSNEVFIYGGRDWVPVLQALAGVLGQANTLSFRQNLRQAVNPQAPPLNPLDVLLPEFLAHSEQMYVPPLIVGFKIGESKEQLAELLEKLAAWVDEQPNVAAQPEKVTIGEGEYYTLRLSGAQEIPPEALQNIRQALLQGGTAPEQTERLIAWLTGQTVAVTVGAFRSYAILSIGRDNEHLKRLGSEPSLGTGKELAPVRSFRDRKLVSISYAAREAMAPATYGGGLPELVEALLQEMPPDKLPEGLAQQLRSDVRELDAEFSARVAEPAALVAVSFLNQGVESYVYGQAPLVGIDYSKPLSILDAAGGTPAFLLASQGAGSVEPYETVVKWVGRAYSYVGDFLVPTLSSSDRAEFEQLQAAVVPFARSLDTTTRESLLPAIDATQSLLLLDEKMRLRQLFLEQPFPKAMPMIEPAFVTELKDSKAFLRAMGEYVTALDELVTKLRAMEQTGMAGEPFRLPRPTSTAFLEGRMYFYQLPMPLDQAILPHAIVTEDLLVLSLSPAQSERIVTGGAEVTDPVLNLEQSAGVIARLRTAELLAAAGAWLEFALVQPTGPLAGAPPEASQAVIEQVRTLLQVLGTLKGVTTRSYLDGSNVVTHSWVEFRDLAEEP